MLTVNNLNKTYKNSKSAVLKNISLNINKGEFIAVMGPSGSGKTTLLNSISGFIPHSSGDVVLNGKNICNLKKDTLSHFRNTSMGFVFQDFMLFNGLSVFENIALPRILGEKNLHDIEHSVNKLCELFNISKLKDSYPATLSGGEKQRTAIARALINSPEILLADEPTGNLDSGSSRSVMSAFVHANESLNSTILMVTHDSYAASYCNRVIILQDGAIYKTLVRNSSREEFFNTLLNVLKELGGTHQ